VRFVDRQDNLHLTFEACLKLAQAFARAEADNVITYIDAGERGFMKRWGDDPHMVQYQARERAANAVAREWTNAPESDRQVNERWGKVPILSVT